MVTNKFSPRSYLRAKRPRLYSDSVVDTELGLDRTILEYQLETLTNRSQEIQFQEFARRIAEKEICPNLLPQTGPTGGGDSKVDTETYPVADVLSLVWLEGVGREAAKERWAFAISAKKDWKTKVRSDIAKIAKTNRGYVKSFFITNQFVSDRDRSKLEDELTQKHKMDVRILDRNWILDRVFDGGHEELAIQELKLAVPTHPRLRKGPLDLQREAELEKLEQRIADSNTSIHHGNQLVDDCLEAARLVRALERRRTEIDGQFVRAERVAEQFGTAHQKLLVAYQWAWTSYFWYEDYPRFVEFYSDAERHAKGSRNPHDLELLTNLWQLLSSLRGNSELGLHLTGFDSHTAGLLDELDRICGDDERPSAAAQAKALRLMVRLVISAPTEVDEVLREFGSLIKGCEGLIGFPFESLAESLIVFGDAFGESSEYQKLFETLLAVMPEREGQVAAARLLTTRGAQQLDAGQAIEAVRSIGRALTRLYKHETRHELVVALHVCAAAYERLGLFWAARGAAIVAASLATNEFWAYEEVTIHQASSYNRIKWLELQLGRIPEILNWHAIDHVSRIALISMGGNAETLLDSELDFDAILGILLLRSELSHLANLTILPDVLSKLDLTSASVALRFALGHLDGIEEEIGGYCHENTLESFFERWRDQPAGESLAVAPILGEESRCELRSGILGCEVTISTINASPYLELAESILAALESLLSTSTVNEVLPLEPKLTVEVNEAQDAVATFRFELVESQGRPHIAISCAPFDASSIPAAMQGDLRNGLVDLLVRSSVSCSDTHSAGGSFGIRFR